MMRLILLKIFTRGDNLSIWETVSKLPSVAKPRMVTDTVWILSGIVRILSDIVWYGQPSLCTLC